MRVTHNHRCFGMTVILTTAILVSACDEIGTNSDARLDGGVRDIPVDARLMDARSEDAAIRDASATEATATSDAHTTDVATFDAMLGGDAVFGVDAQRDAQSDVAWSDTNGSSNTGVLGTYDQNQIFHPWADGERVVWRPQLYVTPMSIDVAVRLPATALTRTATQLRVAIALRALTPPSSYDPEQYYDVLRLNGAGDPTNNWRESVEINAQDILMPRQTVNRSLAFATGDQDAEPEQQTLVRLRVDAMEGNQLLATEMFEQRIVIVPPPENEPRSLMEVGRGSIGSFVRWRRGESISRRANNTTVANFRVAGLVRNVVALRYAFTPVGGGPAIENTVALTFVPGNRESVADNVELNAPNVGDYVFSASTDRLVTDEGARTASIREVAVSIRSEN